MVTPSSMASNTLPTTDLRMVEGWAPALDATRALRLGFAAEHSFDEIIRVHIEDELGGSVR